MGLSLFLIKPICKTCGHQNEGFSANYTYNVSCMWYHIFPKDKQMVDIDGMTGRKASKKLLIASDLFIKNKDDLEKMNPINGFGSYEGFLKFIHELVRASLESPDAIWGSWR